MQVLVVMKKTKFELDKIHFPDLDYYKKICKIQNDSFERIYGSHLRQLESREYLQKNLNSDFHFIFREGLDNCNLKKYGLVISLGGDNHFTYVAHQCKKNRIIGCNSDTKTSFGALLSFDPEKLIQSYKIKFTDTLIEKWALIQCKMTYPNGSKMETVNAVSEISIRNMSPDLTSRYLILYENKKEEQKSSGLLLYTGAGSTGWYASCKSDEDPKSFSKSETYFKAYSRELSRKARARFMFTDFQVNKTLKVISEMNGGISIDALSERVYPFPAGSLAEFSLAKEKLSVVVLK